MEHIIKNNRLVFSFRCLMQKKKKNRCIKSLIFMRRCIHFYICLFNTNELLNNITIIFDIDIVT